MRNIQPFSDCQIVGSFKYFSTDTLNFNMVLCTRGYKEEAYSEFGGVNTQHFKPLMTIIDI